MVPFHFRRTLLQRLLAIQMRLRQQWTRGLHELLLHLLRRVHLWPEVHLLQGGQLHVPLQTCRLATSSYNFEANSITNSIEMLAQL